MRDFQVHVCMLSLYPQVITRGLMKFNSFMLYFLITPVDTKPLVSRLPNAKEEAPLLEVST